MSKEGRALGPFVRARGLCCFPKLVLDYADHRVDGVKQMRAHGARRLAVRAIHEAVED
jgi:hypothetical protein